MGRLKNGLSMRFSLELEMGPFPIELQIENRAVSLQPCGARDGDLCPTYVGFVHGYVYQNPRTHDRVVVRCTR